MKITTLSLALLALFATTDMHCMDNQRYQPIAPLPQAAYLQPPAFTHESRQSLPSAPPSHEQFSQEYELPVVPPPAYTEQDLESPISIALRNQRARNVLSTVVQKQAIIAKQHELFKEHQLVGSYDTASTLLITVAYLNVMNFAKDAYTIYLNQDNTTVVTRLLECLPNAAVTLGLGGAAMLYQTRCATHTQKLNQLLLELHALTDGSELKPEHAHLCDLNRSVGSHKAAAKAFMGAGALLVLNECKDAILCLTTQPWDTISTISVLANGTGGLVALGLFFRSRYLHQRRKAEAADLLNQLDQLILEEQEEV